MTIEPRGGEFPSAHAALSFCRKFGNATDHLNVPDSPHLLHRHLQYHRSGRGSVNRMHRLGDGHQANGIKAILSLCRCGPQRTYLQHKSDGNDREFMTQNGLTLPTLYGPARRNYQRSFNPN